MFTVSEIEGRRTGNAIYCLSGHFIAVFNRTIRARSGAHLRALMERASQNEGEERPARFCTKCGAATISACQHCQTKFEYRFVGDRPSYCGGCGKALPWTEAALSAAREYTEELSQLNEIEKTNLNRIIVDLTSETERTPLAVNRFKVFMTKIGPSAATILTETIKAVVSEAAKKMLGL